MHWFFMRPLLHLHGWDLVAEKLLHVVVPVLVVVGWLVFGPRRRIGRADLVGCLVLPVVWLAYTLVRAAVVHWYQYPFIDVDAHGYAYVAGACIGVAALMTVLALGCRWLDRRLPGPA